MNDFAPLILLIPSILGYLLIGSLFFFCVYCNSLGFVFSESISYVFREVRLLKWPVTINNFALGL